MGAHQWRGVIEEYRDRMPVSDATPVVTPPCVCIVGAGRLHHAIVPVLGGMETHRMMPLSLTFDHRAATDNFS